MPDAFSNLGQYLSQAYGYIGQFMDMVMQQWYVAVLVGIAIILVSRYLENIVVIALTVVIGVFGVLPVVIQAFKTQNWVLGIIMLVVLVFLYYIVKFLYKVGLFLLGFAAGYILATTVLGVTQIPGINAPTEITTGFGTFNWVGIVVGILIGWLTVVLTRYLFTLIGVFAGSYLSALGILVAYTGDPTIWQKAFPNPANILTLEGLENPQQVIWVFFGSLVAFFIFGVVINFRRRKPKQMPTQPPSQT